MREFLKYTINGQWSKNTTAYTMIHIDVTDAPICVTSLFEQANIVAFRLCFHLSLILWMYLGMTKDTETCSTRIYAVTRS